MPEFPENIQDDNAGKAGIRLPQPLPRWENSGNFFPWRSAQGKSGGNRRGCRSLR
jgi:hypothetical protein